MTDEDLEVMRCRLHNTEVALLALWSLTKDSFPVHTLEAADQMMTEYFDKQEELGAFSHDGFFIDRSNL